MRRRGKSLSAIVADFFLGLDAPGPEGAEPRLPAVRSLIGALAGREVAEEDYRTYLRHKHR